MPKISTFPDVLDKVTVDKLPDRERIVALLGPVLADRSVAEIEAMNAGFSVLRQNIVELRLDDGSEIEVQLRARMTRAVR